MHPTRTLAALASFASALILSVNAHAAPPAGPAAKDAPQKSATPYVETAADGRGVVFDAGVTGVIPAGRAFGDKGLGFAPGLALGLDFGFYPTRHFGVTIGGRVSEHRVTGWCTDKIGNDADCGGFTFQAPVMLQYAFKSRKEGFYLQAGVGLFTRYFVVADNGTFSFGNDFLEGKAGLGYRIRQNALLETGKASGRSLDLFAMADVGRFDQVSAHLDGLSASGAIDEPALHCTFQVGAKIHFTP